MSLALTVLLFVVGLVLIIKGGDFFVDAATWIAEVSGLPKFLIGATVVSFATTLPELLVSMIAAGQGKVDLSIGNAIGSVTANTALIMAIAIVCMPTVIKRGPYMLKSLLLLSSAAVIMVSGFVGGVGLVSSVVLLALFVVAVYDNIAQARLVMGMAGKNADGVPARPKPEGRVVATNIAKFVLGAAGIVIGAQLLVDNGSELARFAGVPERIIGVTIIAIGTSLPELVTTISAIVKKQASLSFGNIVGANIIDLTLILPLSAIVAGKALPVSAGAAMFDLPTCFIVGLVALVPTLITKKFHRWQGVLLLVLYTVYLLITCGLLG